MRRPLAADPAVDASDLAVGGSILGSVGVTRIHFESGINSLNLIYVAFGSNTDPDQYCTVYFSIIFHIGGMPVVPPV